VGGVVFEDANVELVLADPRLVSHVPADHRPRGRPEMSNRSAWRPRPSRSRI
jgi:hypothetical protein